MTGIQRLKGSYFGVDEDDVLVKIAEEDEEVAAAAAYAISEIA